MAATLVRWLEEKGQTAAVEPRIAAEIEMPSFPLDQTADADLVVTLGGDGTLIRAAHLCSQKGTPILGVHFGRFGFVTQCTPEDVGAALSDFFDGNVRIEERMMVQAQVVRSGQVVAEQHCLNEAALHREVTARMITWKVSVDGRALTRYPSDGVLVATPTGSTAYNLSAGGPILDPVLEAMVLTAITPHTLSARPLVLCPSSVVEIYPEPDGGSVLSGDGQSRVHLMPGDLVSLTRSSRVTRLVNIEEQDFLIKLGSRLLWSQSVVGVDE